MVFAKNHNLYMMDAANYAKALKNANDATIVETQLTTDGVEDFGYGGGRGMGGGSAATTGTAAERAARQGQDNKTMPASAPVNVSWSRDSKKFALVRRDAHKVAKLWVINSLANPRPTLETYSYAMPGDADIPQSQLEIFDVAAKAQEDRQGRRLQDETLRSRWSAPPPRMREEHEKTEPLWANPGSDKLYFTRMSRDLHRLDVCVADTATGEVKPLIQERMNVYIETKPLRLINNGAEMVWWTERDGWGHYYLYDADGTLKNQITKGEFVAEDISYIDEKARAIYLTAVGPRGRRKSVLHALSTAPNWMAAA